MSDLVQLNHQTENTYEFDIEIDGLDSIDVRAWFVICTSKMELTFPCTQVNSHFTCKIPPMPFLEKTAYRGAVRLVADDYFFEPVSNLVVNVTGNLSFEKTDIVNMKVQPTLDMKAQSVPTKITEPDGPAVKTEVQRVENPDDIIKRMTNERVKSKKVKKILAESADIPAKKAPYKKTSSSKTLREMFEQDKSIEDEVSTFVNEEQKERSEKLRDILKNFTVSPTSTPTKTKFIKKS